MTHKHKLRPRLVGGYWSIQGSVPLLGRIRKQFRTKEEAQFESQKLITQVDNHLAGAEIRETLLSKEQERESVSALQLLESTPSLQGKTLLEVIAWAGKAWKADVIDRSVDECRKEFILELESLGRSEVYINGVNNKLLKLDRWFGSTPYTTKGTVNQGLYDFVGDITTDDIRSYISDDDDAYGPFAGREVSKTTRTNELTVLKSFFTFCENRKYIAKSPIDKSIRRPGVNRGEIKALELVSVHELMVIADALPINIRDYAVPFMALSLFAGLRPQELRPQDGLPCINWDDFTWREKESTLVVSYQVGKVTSRRVVKLPENCVEWIRPFDRKTGPVINCSYAQWRGVFDYIRAMAGYKVYGQHFKHLDPDLAKVSNDTTREKWVPDVLRHTAISYFLEIHDGNKDKTSSWAGNSPAVIDQHYRSLIKGDKDFSPTQQAKAYWEIRPSSD